MAANAAPPAKRYPRLRETHVKMLATWRRELDAPRILATAFPTLSTGHKPVALALQSLYDQFWEQFDSNVMAEFDKIAEETSVAERLAALEQLMADHDAGVVPLPPAATTLPEDEVRTCAVELKLAHEAKLRSLLHSLRSENDSLEATVRKDTATIERIAADIATLEGVVREVAAAAGVSEGGAA